MWSRILLACSLLLAVWLYRPGLSGPFVFDDGINIVANQSLKLQELTWPNLLQAVGSIPNGMFGRPLSMLSFALNYYFERANESPEASAYAFKAVNLAIHIANAVLLFLFCRLLLLCSTRADARSSPRAELIALCVTAAWVCHPVNVTSVLYVVQRMASLSAFFTLGGLVLFLTGRRRLLMAKPGGRWRVLCSLLVFTPLAFLCKETGLLLPGYILLIEWAVFRLHTARNNDRVFLLLLYGGLLVLPLLGLGLYGAMHGQWITAAYARRDFTLGERLLTEARALWFYLRLILLPNATDMGLYHDDFPVSRGWFTPLSTVPALLGLLALAAFAWSQRQSRPLLSIGIGIFLLGHSLESSFIPLELMHEHRNYFPSTGILLAFFTLLLDATVSKDTLRLRVVCACLLLPLFAFVTYSRANDWSTSESLWAAEVAHHPGSVRANVAQADLFANLLSLNPEVNARNYAAAKQAYERTLEIDPKSSGALFGLLHLGRVFDKPVEAKTVDELSGALASGTLPANTNDRLIELASCTTAKSCPINSGELERLLTAAIRNPGIQGREKALILMAQTYYQFQQGDYSGALASTRQAMALSGDIENQLWLATILIAMRDEEQAARQMEVLQQLAPGRIGSDEMQSLQQGFAAIRKKQ